MASDTGRDREWYLRRIEYLSEFMTPERAAVLRRTLGNRTRWMGVCMENTFHPQNASALVRNCEAFGIQDIHTIQTTCKFSPNVRIVRGTDKWIDLHRHQSTGDALEYLRGRGYRIVATTPREGGATPESFDVARSPFVLVFGTEHEGISAQAASEADESITIPMCGMVESLNVSASAAILLYNLSSRLRASAAPWRLDDDQSAEILFRWMMETLKDAENILSRFDGR